MKKYKIVIGLFALALSHTYAQYGDVTYPHTNTYLQAGKVTGINSTGFVMASLVPGSTGWMTTDLIIEKTDANGQFGSSLEFSQTFSIKTDPTCSSGTTPPMNYYHGFTGVNVIEIAPGANGETYAVVAVNKTGLVFMTLDASGTLVNLPLYWNTNNVQLGKPSIRQSAFGTHVYICGSIGSDSYVMRIPLNGAPAWSKRFSGMLIEARDLIESANGNDVVVVGRCTYNAMLAHDAFFLKLNAGNGAINMFRTYSDGITGDEWFNVVEHASNVAGTGIGYVIGGRMGSQQAQYSGYRSWVVKLDVNGNFIFNTLIGHYSEVYDVIERFNGVTAPYPYEYFAIGRSNPSGNNSALIVWKLNELGLNGSYSPEVWEYGIGTFVANDISYANLEKIGDGTGAGDGYTAFVTNASSANNVMIKSFYNGVNGCQSSGDYAMVRGPQFPASPNLNSVNFQQYCPYIWIDQWANTVTPGTVCGWISNPAGGNNLRPADITGLSSQAATPGMIAVYPNPSNGIFTVEVGTHAAPATIKIMNAMGQLIKEMSVDSETQKVSLSAENLGLSEGLYFVDVTVNDHTQTHKIVYQK